MIPVNYCSIYTFKLPLNDKSMVIKKSVETREAKKKVKKFKKEYRWNPDEVCYAFVSGNVAYNYIPFEERKELFLNYELLVRSSLRYRFLIFISRNLQ